MGVFLGEMNEDGEVEFDNKNLLVIMQSLELICFAKAPLILVCSSVI